MSTAPSAAVLTCPVSRACPFPQPCPHQAYFRADAMSALAGAHRNTIPTTRAEQRAAAAYDLPRSSTPPEPPAPKRHCTDCRREMRPSHGRPNVACLACRLKASAARTRPPLTPCPCCGKPGRCVTSKTGLCPYCARLLRSQRVRLTVAQFIARQRTKASGCRACAGPIQRARKYRLCRVCQARWCASVSAARIACRPRPDFEQWVTIQRAKNAGAPLRTHDGATPVVPQPAMATAGGAA